jgi:8-oxo-dGTP pyrophosphatase MutT (NUDIX family)
VALRYPEDYDALAVKRVSAGCLMRDEAGRVLLLETTYKPGWEVPGGGAEPGETPRQTALREAREELGLDVTITGLACVDHVDHEHPRRDALRFLFLVAGPPVALDTLTLQASEIASAHYCDLAEIERRASRPLFRRLAACLGATAFPLYLEDGVPLG